MAKEKSSNGFGHGGGESDMNLSMQTQESVWTTKSDIRSDLEMHSIAPSTHGLFQLDHRPTNTIDNETQLHRKLNPRHFFMISYLNCKYRSNSSVGSSIGMALWVGSGAALSYGGIPQL